MTKKPVKKKTTPKKGIKKKVAKKRVPAPHKFTGENFLFPGRPNYVGPTRGYFAMLHHTILYEYSRNVMQRVDYVKGFKPRKEQPTRLHNMLYLGDEDPGDGGQAAVLAIVKKHIPDHAWSKRTGEMKFPKR